MPPKQTQKQKQKQTVIVNIGSTVVKKRKRKPRKKKSAAGSSRSSMPPPPPPSMDLRQVLYPPQPQIRGDDNLAIQLNSVTKQLQDLQDKQQHRTANLMAGARAIAREEGVQGSVMEEVAPPQQEEETQLKKKAAARRTKQQIQDDEDAAAAAAAAAGEVPKPKRVYVKKQTKAEEAAAILLQQSGVIGRRQEPSLADYDGGSGMSSVTMTPGLYPSPAFETAGNRPVKKLSVRSPTETPETISLSGTSLNSPSAQTERRF